MSLKIVIGLTKVLIAEEAVVGGERGRVRRLEYQVFGAVYLRTLLASVITPQEKNEMFTFS